MGRIIINDIEYTDDVDKRFAGCEFCDVRLKDYDFFKRHCLDTPFLHRLCGDANYLKRVNIKND